MQFQLLDAVRRAVYDEFTCTRNPMMPKPRRGTSPNRPPGGKGTDPSLAAFLNTLRCSKLLEPNRLDARVANASAAVLASARRLAEYLIELGELTHYQAEKLLGGRWRGLVVGPYQILAPLGCGGMGAVYLAKSSAQPIEKPYPLYPLVALKVLPPKRAREEKKTLLRFRREMELGKNLDHPNITRTLDTGEHNGVYFIAMEYVPGLSMSQLVTKDGPLSVGDAARLFADVAAGLNHAHDRGLIHRDLKPSNIMVTPEGQAKILDLGLAMYVDEALPEDPTIVGGEGYILGTMDYIAPEQTSDSTNVGPRTDLYSLGCSIYYSVCGVPPFPGGTARQKMKWHRTETAPNVRVLNSNVPLGFAMVVERCMAKKPTDRPISGEAVRRLLLPWATPPRAAGSASPRSDRAVVAGVDTRNLDPALWDAVPMAEWAEADPEEERRWPWKLTLGGCGIAFALVVLALLLMLMRRL